MIAVCCAMNNNRSMETHSLFNKKNINIKSYGTSNQIKLPGLSLLTPNVYDFGTTYKQIYDNLVSQNNNYYEKIGLLHLLERNMKIKDRPENFFEAIEQDERFELVITCEERCFLSIYRDIGNRNYNADIIKRENTNANNFDRGFWLVNFDIKDTVTDAVFGANDIYSFVALIKDNDIEKAIEEYSIKSNKEMLFTYIIY